MFREHSVPDDVPVIERSSEPVKLTKLIASEGLVSSVSDAQRKIGEGAVKINGEKVSDVKLDVTGNAGEEILIQVGKRKFLRVTFK